MDEITKLEVAVDGRSCIFISKNKSGEVVNKYTARIHDECVKYLAFISQQASDSPKIYPDGSESHIHSDKVESYFKSIFEKQCA